MECKVTGIMDNSKKMIQVEPDQYFNPSYDSKGRFCCYWHQIHEIIILNPEKVLEVGIGNGFLFKYLKERMINVITLDIDERLNPDIVGNILNIPFEDNSFDVVACYEVLEHQPYENFYKALSEIFRVSNAHAILSLPDVERVYRFNIRVPKLGEIKRLIPLPKFKKPLHEFNGEHYWEIGKAGYPLSKIIDDIQRTGFKVESTYRVFENPYHRFFVLKKDSE
jgi:ubiquinone/menaquinone biosynthesis C-methylase UbiE